MDDRAQAVAAKQRMANFRLRQGSSSMNTTTTPHAPPVKSHARSHSRNSSITSFPLSISTMDNAPPANESPMNSTPVPNSPSPRSRPNSHHRRRSSVSTRRESAEMMGVAPPPETGSDAVDDQSELRRLALWALEGKGRSDNAFIGGFTKVEIPELNTPDSESGFDAIQAPKLKPTLATFGMSNTLAGKRDSFGKLLLSSSNSLKDQLHTLLEEEEEEEEEEEDERPSEQGKEETNALLSDAVDSFGGLSPLRDESPNHPTVAFQSGRHRPTNLTLRPLSLTPESLPLSRTESLPTPSPTPSPRMGGLKSLTLAPSPSDSSISSASSRRQSLFVSPSPQHLDSVQRRQSIGGFPSPTPSVPKRKSSISYKCTNSGDSPSGHLPTPGPTPTSPMPPLHVALPPVSSSSSSHVPDLDRPLSPTEQAFLFRSHTSLLCRISDLEKAIAEGRGRLPPGAGVGLNAGIGLGTDELRERSRSHERPTSIMSTSATSEPESISSSPSDEMLHLVADLKAERDELMRDAEGWRMRIADMEKQVGTLTRRVEAERRESWVIRERLGVVEVEKKRVKEEMERGRLECRRLEKAVRTEETAKIKAEEDVSALGKVLKEERIKREMAEREVDRLRMELEQVRARAEQVDADLQALLVTPKVEMKMRMPNPRRLNSIDSQMSTSSTTDVEEYVPVEFRSLKLNVVEEEEEDRDLPQDVTSEIGSESDNDELAHYEDEGGLDDDMIFSDDQTSSSFGSIARSNSHLLRLDLAAAVPPSEPVPSTLPSHAKTGSMEKGWSFPQGAGQPSVAQRDPPKVDRFFECLDALDESDVDEVNELPTYDSATAKQFWRGAVKDADNDGDGMPLFVLPAQPSPPRKEKEWKEIEAAKLEVLAEEEEEEESLIPFRYPYSSAATENKYSLHASDAFNTDPVTPRPATSARMLPAPASTPTKHAKVRKTSVDLTIPGFKPHSGSVPVLKAAPPPKANVLARPPTTPTMTSTTDSAVPAVFSTLIPQPSRSPPSSARITPPKPRAAGPTLIPRLSTSPKSSSATTIPTTRTPTKTSPALVTKLMPPSKTMTTSTPPVFMPQPKSTSKPITRSSLLPPKPPVLTRLSLLQQTAPPVSSAALPSTQGLTAKLSQQMQSLTSFWSPWSPNSSIARNVATASEPDAVPDQRRAREYVSKERQLERLRSRLQREVVSAESCEQCASCRDGVIVI